MKKKRFMLYGHDCRSYDESLHVTPKESHFSDTSFVPICHYCVGLDHI